MGITLNTPISRDQAIRDREFWVIHASRVMIDSVWIGGFVTEGCTMHVREMADGTTHITRYGMHRGMRASDWVHVCVGAARLTFEGPAAFFRQRPAADQVFAEAMSRDVLGGTA